MLAAIVYIIAGISASDAVPNQHLTMSVGVEGCVGVLRIAPVQGISSTTAVITSTAHVDRNLAVYVRPNAQPGLRHLVVQCGQSKTTEDVHLNVITGKRLLYIPLARK